MAFTPGRLPRSPKQLIMFPNLMGTLAEVRKDRPRRDKLLLKPWQQELSCVYEKFSRNPKSSRYRKPLTYAEMDSTAVDRRATQQQCCNRVAQSSY